MTVEIADVKRVNGKAVRLVAWIGDIESKWVRRFDTGEPYEESRMRAGVQVLDQETLWIPDSDHQELQEKVQTIFSEDRSKSRLRKKKFQSELQGKLL